MQSYKYHYKYLTSYTFKPTHYGPETRVGQHLRCSLSVPSPFRNVHATKSPVTGLWTVCDHLTLSKHKEFVPWCETRWGPEKSLPLVLDRQF